MDLDQIVSVVITESSATPSRVGFSIPLVVASHASLTGMHTYSASTMLASMVTDGVATTAPVYLTAQRLLSQNPRPRTIKVWYSATTFTQTVNLTPVAASSTVYNGRVADAPWTFTSDASATLAEVCTGIAAAITALTGVTATGVSATEVVVTTDAARTNVMFEHGTGAGVYSIHDVTDRTDLATTLAAAQAADRDWYGFVVDSFGEADIDDAAAWAEANNKVFFATTCDDDVYTSSTTDVASDLKALGYRRTFLFYSDDPTTFLGAGALGAVLPYDAGSATLYYKNAVGVAVSDLSSTQEGFLSAKNVNWLSTTADVRIINDGKSVGGSWFDNVAAIDWVTARIKEDLFAFLTGSIKVSYTDRSVEKVKDVLMGVLNLGIARGIIAPGVQGSTTDPVPFVEAPKVADVSVTDRGNRLLPDVYFSFRLSGGLKTIEVQGVATV
ncbi:MAG: hypothetical protein RL701_4525 [Pseudomonadota bacterium]|jgi:hypothetical protein